MKKLRLILERLETGEKIKGFPLSITDIRTLRGIYNNLMENKKASFISANCFLVINCCPLKVKEEGIGWIVTI